MTNQQILKHYKSLLRQSDKWRNVMQMYLSSYDYPLRHSGFINAYKAELELEQRLSLAELKFPWLKPFRNQAYKINLL